MKRLMLIAGMLVLLVAAASFAIDGRAESDAVPVLQTQVADLQARVAALEGIFSPMSQLTPSTTQIGRPGVTVTPTTSQTNSYVLQGMGPASTNPLIFRTGYLSASLVCSDDDGGSLRLFTSGDSIGASIATVSTTSIDAGAYVVDVHCLNDWVLTITAK